MPRPKAEAIQLSAEHEQTLHALTRAHSTPQKPVERAHIVLLASEGLSNTEIAQRLEI